MTLKIRFFKSNVIDHPFAVLK